MSQEQHERSPSDRFRTLMGVLMQPGHVAEIERGIQNPVRDPGEIEWRDDPDPFGGNWDWLTPDPEAGEDATPPESQLP